MPAPSVWIRPEQVDERGRAVQLAPALAADPAARVEGEAEQRGEVAADDPGRDVGRPVVDRERDRDPGDARLQERVAEQRHAVQGDRERGSRARSARGRRRARGGAAAGRRGRRRASGRSAPTTATSTSATTPAERLSSHQVCSCGFMPPPPATRSVGLVCRRRVTIRPPWRRSQRCAPRGPLSSAALASASASSAVGASAVALIRPVQAGCRVHGSSRWWRGVPSGARHRRRVDARGGDGAVLDVQRVDAVSRVSGWRTSTS